MIELGLLIVAFGAAIYVYTAGSEPRGYRNPRGERKLRTHHRNLLKARK